MKRDFFVMLAAVILTFVPQTLVAQIHFTATLDGTQQTPEVVTSATGTGSFELSENLTELRYFLSYQGMSAGGVVGYLYAGEPGVNGTIIKSLTMPTLASGTFNGVWWSTDSEPLTRALAESLLTGRVYIDLLDSKNPAGEIRGQLTLATSLHFEANCEGAQESPPVSATGGGTGVFVLDPTRTQIDYRATYYGLTGTLTSGGQIHTGVIGTNGLSVRTIAFTGDLASATVKGSWKATDSQPLTAAMVDSLIAGKMYVNFHTALHDGGEIRGQLVLRGGIGFMASLDSSQVKPPSSANASGTGSFILNEAHNKLTYNLTYIGFSSGLQTGGQIHVGSTGINGSAVKTIASSGNASEATIFGTWTATDMIEEFTTALVESLLIGDLYVDFNASADSGSKIRGQLNLTTGIGLTSQLSVSQDVPPTVQSNGTGTASVVVRPDRQSVSYSLTYLNLSSTIAQAGGHFHIGARGVNGGNINTIVSPNALAAGSVNSVWRMSDGGTYPLTPAIVNAFVSEDIYINLHTGDYIGGEIRGQVSYGFDVLTSVVNKPLNFPEKFDLEQNYPNPFNPSTIIRYQLPNAGHVTLKVYDILGREVATLVDGVKEVGSYSVTFDGEKLASGVYISRLTAGNYTKTMKMVLMK